MSTQRSGGKWVPSCTTFKGHVNMGDAADLVYSSQTACKSPSYPAQQAASLDLDGGLRLKKCFGWRGRSVVHARYDGALYNVQSHAAIYKGLRTVYTIFYCVRKVTSGYYRWLIEQIVSGLRPR